MTGMSWSVDAHAPPNRGGHLLARSSDSSVCASYVYAAVPPHLFPRRASADVERVDGSRSSGAPQPRGGQPLGSRHARAPAQAAERIRAAGAARPGPAAGSRWGLGARAQRHAQISRELQPGIGPAVGFLEPAFGQLEPTCDGPFGYRPVGSAIRFSLPKLCFTI